MPSTNIRIQRGRGAEELAALFFSERGRIVARNYYAGRLGEIDLAVVIGDTLIFVEVRSQASGKFGGAELSIRHNKITKLRKAAMRFIAEFPGLFGAINIRFDLVAVDGEELVWIRDISR